MMGISSLGAGSSILTQDVIDQLKAADKAKFVTPLDTKLKAEKDKKAAFDVVDALMDNVYQSLKSLTEYGVFEARTTTVSDEKLVDVTALENSDIQDFSLDVTTLATKEIEQSGTFSKKTDTIASGNGQMKLDIGDKSFTFDYTADTTLEELKDMINKDAGDSVTATIIQVADDDFRLLLNADNTGTGQDITLTDVDIDGDDDDQHLKDALTVDVSNVQTAVDASFKFNGLDITRKSNKVDDLLSGVTLTLKDTGKVDVSVKQDREHIEDKITNFVDKYNSAMYQLDEDTKSSTKADERGIFSAEATIKNMKSSLVNILASVGEGQGSIQKYGIEVSEDGRLSLDSTVLNEQLDKDPLSTKAYFVGGDFTTENGSVVKLKGIFTDIEAESAKYSKYGAVLDKFDESMTTRTESLNNQKEKATKRLESSYAIMTKRFAAYDLVISKFNSASSMFSQMIEAELASKK